LVQWLGEGLASVAVIGLGLPAPGSHPIGKVSGRFGHGIGTRSHRQSL
jgi:hypothetical protein